MNTTEIDLWRVYKPTVCVGEKFDGRIKPTAFRLVISRSLQFTLIYYS